MTPEYLAEQKKIHLAAHKKLLRDQIDRHRQSIVNWQDMIDSPIQTADYKLFAAMQINTQRENLARDEGDLARLEAGQ